eukprot:gene37157-48551_t
MSVYDKLKELNITLPPVSVPAAAYVPYVQTGNLVFLSGHIARKDGKPWAAQFGRDIGTEEGKAAARAVAIDLMGTLHAATGGDLNRVQRIVKVMSLVNSTGDFTEQHLVTNGASELLGQVFGDKGVHARSAFGVAQSLRAFPPRGDAPSAAGRPLRGSAGLRRASFNGLLRGPRCGLERLPVLVRALGQGGCRGLGLGWRGFGARRAQLTQLIIEQFVIAAEGLKTGVGALHHLQPFHGCPQLLFQSAGALEGPAVFQPLHPLLQSADGAALLAHFAHHHHKQHRQHGGQARLQPRGPIGHLGQGLGPEDRAGAGPQQNPLILAAARPFGYGPLRTAC